MAKKREWKAWALIRDADGLLDLSMYSRRSFARKSIFRDSYKRIIRVRIVEDK